MNEPKLYRRRLIPDECIPLENDHIISHDEECLITTWNTLKPKITLHHGCSCYFLKEGLKISKFYREDGTLMFWYCDIVECTEHEEENALVFTDLLADVIIYPDGRIHVVDLDELAEAFEKGLITASQMAAGLRQLNRLLDCLYKGEFSRLQAPLESRGL